MNQPLTLAERCKLATDCLPQAEYRTRLEALHAELLADCQTAAAERERCAAFVQGRADACRPGSEEQIQLASAAACLRASRPS